MDAKSFDSWTRSRAAATNRRTLLGAILAGGVATLFSRKLSASAQLGGGGGGSCTYAVTLTSSLTTGATAAGS
jgi:hypothetical protein